MESNQSANLKQGDTETTQWPLSQKGATLLMHKLALPLPTNFQLFQLLIQQYICNRSRHTLTMLLHYRVKYLTRFSLIVASTWMFFGPLCIVMRCVCVWSDDAGA